jgi:elongation factor Ts
MNITAAMVKDLREKTGAGMMDCKSALVETNGDMEAAVDWLRTKGLVKAAGKAGRIAAEGVVAIASEGKRAAMVEVNSETDFVARNPDFQKLARGIAEAALSTNGTLDRILEAKLPHGKMVETAVREAIASIGENITVRRAALINVKDGVVGSYIHAAVGPGLGKIGVLVGIESGGKSNGLETIGKQVAMHIAAANPLAIRVEELDPELVARERAIYAEQARASGKPESIVDKMVEGRMRKFHEEAVLLSQIFVLDTEKTVAKALESAEIGVGGAIGVTEFVCFRLGEGIEKKSTDFAAEVAAAAGIPKSNAGADDEDDDGEDD